MEIASWQALLLVLVPSAGVSNPYGWSFYVSTAALETSQGNITE